MNPATTFAFGVFYGIALGIQIAILFQSWIKAKNQWYKDQDKLSRRKK
jgi:hypothetical protein